jgi:hypothetical protein
MCIEVAAQPLRDDYQSASLRFALPSFLDIREWHVLGIDAEVSASSKRQDLLQSINENVTRWNSSGAEN